MIRVPRLAPLALALTIAGVAGAGATPPMDRFEIVPPSVDTAGWQSLSLPWAVWDTALPDLADLHAVGDDGELPLLLLPAASPPSSSAGTEPGRLERRIEADDGQSVDLVAPPGLRHAGVRLRFGVGTFVARVTAEALEEGGVVGVLTRDVVWSTDAGSRLDLSWRPAEFPRVRLRWTVADPGAGEADLVGADFLRADELDEAPIGTRLPLELDAENAGARVRPLRTPHPGLPVERIVCPMPEGEPVDARVSVHRDLWVNGRIEPERIGRARWLDAHGGRELAVDLSEGPTSSRLWIVSSGAFLPPLGACEAEVRRREVLVYRRPGDGLRLRWGSGREVSRTDADTQLLARWGAAPVAQVSAGALEIVPIPGAAPLDPLAGLPTRARLPDTGDFAWRATVTAEGGTGGWRRLPLGPRAVAAARADLADVRLAADDGTALPWVGVIGRSTEIRTLEILDDREEDGWQVLDLDLGPDLLPVAALELEASGGPFDRATELRGASDSGRNDLRSLTAGRIRTGTPNGARSTLVPAGAWLARHGDELASDEFPPLVEATGRNLSGRLELRIETGENLPLEIVGVRAILAGAEIWYPEARPAAFLYLGAPDLAPPDYDLEAAPAPWSRGSPRPAVAGEPGPNPERSASALRLVEERPIVLWIVVLAAIALLGGVLLRTLGPSRG